MYGSLIQSVFGYFVLLSIPYFLSEKRKSIHWRPVTIGISLQIILAVVVDRIKVIRWFFEQLAHGIESIKLATIKGTSFVFGYIGGGPCPFEIPSSLAGNSFVFAFQALPMIMVMSAISMLLFHWNVIPTLVRFISKGLQSTLRIGGAMGILASTKIFLGQIESALLIRPYLEKFSRSEIFMVMCCGMATTSAAVMSLYGTILESKIQDPVVHILISSIISIPLSLSLARMLIPDEELPTGGDMVKPYNFQNTMDAVSKGSQDSIPLFLGIIAMLIVTAALVAIANNFLGFLPHVNNLPITLERIFGFIASPIAWLMGIPWAEANIAGELLGVKTVLNEIFAFADLAKTNLPQKSTLIMTYALCSFANFACVAITVSGLITMAPERRGYIINLGMKSMWIGTITTCMNGTLMGILFELKNIFGI